LRQIKEFALTTVIVILEAQRSAWIQFGGRTMLRLAAVLYILVASATGGAAVIAVLTLDMRQGWQIAAAFCAGLVVAVPIAALLARRIYNALQGPKPV
jgi:uncharacterized membrane protein YhaH (DUF805 family)